MFQLETVIRGTFWIGIGNLESSLKIEFSFTISRLVDTNPGSRRSRPHRLLLNNKSLLKIIFKRKFFAMFTYIVSLCVIKIHCFL